MANLLTTTDRSSQAYDEPRFSLKVILVLLACFFGVALISKFLLINNSLRLDEAQNLWQSSHSLGGLLRVVANDVHVPLYHLMLHFWILYFGHGVATIRLLSLLFFMINIPVFYLLARQILKVNWALFAVVLFSFSPFMNWYGNEARMYSLLALMATLSQYYFVKIVKTDKGWLGYGITSLIGVYTHYFFTFNLLVQGLYFIFNRKKFKAGSFKRLAIITTLVVLELTPWLYYFHSLGSAKNTRPTLGRPSTVDLSNVFSQFSFGFQNDHINTILVSAWPILVVVALLAVKYRQNVSRELGYLMAAGFLPILLSFGLSHIVSPFFLSRYMIACVPSLTILVVWLISNYRRKLSLIVSSGLITLLTLTSISQVIDAQVPVKENYRGVAQLISAQAQPQDEVVLSTPFTVYPFEYYYDGVAKIYTLPEWDRRSVGAIPHFSEAKLPQEVTQLSKNHRYVYLVLSYDQGYESQIHSYYAAHFKLIKSQFFSHDLHLYVYQIDYHIAPSLSKLSASYKVQ